ncbi:unnamed protein product [Choristocarpus tenellus]
MIETTIELKPKTTPSSNDKKKLPDTVLDLAWAPGEGRDKVGSTFSHLAVAWFSEVRLWRVSRSEGGIHAVEVNTNWDWVKRTKSDSQDEDGSSRRREESIPRSLVFQPSDEGVGVVPLAVWYNSEVQLLGPGRRSVRLPSPVPRQRSCGAWGGCHGELLAISSGGEVRVYSPLIQPTDTRVESLNGSVMEGAEPSTPSLEEAGWRGLAENTVIRAKVAGEMGNGTLGGETGSMFRTVLCVDGLVGANSNGIVRSLPSQEPAPEPMLSRSSLPNPQARIGNVRAMCAAGPRGFFATTSGGLALEVLEKGRRSGMDLHISGGESSLLPRTRCGKGEGMGGSNGGDLEERFLGDFIGESEMSGRLDMVNMALESALGGGQGRDDGYSMGVTPMVSANLCDNGRELSLEGERIETVKFEGAQGVWSRRGEARVPRVEVSQGYCTSQKAQCHRFSLSPSKGSNKALASAKPPPTLPSPSAGEISEVLDLRGKIGLGTECTGGVGSSVGVNPLLILPLGGNLVSEQLTGHVPSSNPLTTQVRDTDRVPVEGTGPRDCCPRLLHIQWEKCLWSRGPAAEGQEAKGGIRVDVSIPLPHALSSPDMLAASKNGDLVAVGSSASNLVACYHRHHIVSRGNADTQRVEGAGKIRDGRREDCLPQAISESSTKDATVRPLCTLRLPPEHRARGLVFVSSSATGAPVPTTSNIDSSLPPTQEIVLVLAAAAVRGKLAKPDPATLGSGAGRGVVLCSTRLLKYHLPPPPACSEVDDSNHAQVLDPEQTQVLVPEGERKVVGIRGGEKQELDVRMTNSLPGLREHVDLAALLVDRDRHSSSGILDGVGDSGKSNIVGGAGHDRLGVEAVLLAITGLEERLGSRLDKLEDMVLENGKRLTKLEGLSAMGSHSKMGT